VMEAAYTHVRAAVTTVVDLLQRWPELWDLSVPRKIAVITLWMFLCSLATLVVTR
jgi:hypothetical protein